MAPEQLAGTPVAASDQYALGIMVYELLTGHTPFHGTLPQAIPHMHANVDPKPPSTVNPSLSPTLNAIVLQALAKKPQDRFALVKEFVSAFAAALKPNTAQSPEVQKRPRQITPKRLPEYAPAVNPSAAKKVSSRTTTPDTKWAPRKYSFLWLSYTLGIEFYREGLGLPLREWGEAIAFFELKGTWLALFPREALARDANVPAQGEGFPGFTLAHDVRSKEEVDHVLQQAQQAGASLAKPAVEADWGGYSGYFQDPDGYLWEVAWNPHFWIE